MLLQKYVCAQEQKDTMNSRANRKTRKKGKKVLNAQAHINHQQQQQQQHRRRRRRRPQNEKKEKAAAAAR